MRLTSLMALVAAALSASWLPSTARAHASVVASTPVEAATVQAPRIVTLTFNEAMLQPTVGASIVMTGMPGMANHQPMVIRNFVTNWSPDGRSMTLTLRQPLRAGTYEVRWQGAGADTHRMAGKLSFTAR